MDVLEAGTGVNLWREWAKVELAGPSGAYQVPRIGSACAGIALCLARQAQPDTSGYKDPEIVTRIAKSHHAGLIVC